MNNADQIKRFIERKADQEGRFQFPVAEACDFLGVSQADYYRRLYHHRDRIDTIAPQTISRDNLFLLIAGMCDDVDACETELHRVGISLSVDDRIRLSERYLFSVSRLIDDHAIDHDTFSRMVEHFSTKTEAARVYIEHFFDLEALIFPTAQAFVDASREMIPHLAYRSAVDYLLLLFKRNVLRSQELLEPVIGRLIPERETGDRKPCPETPIDRALKTLNLRGIPDSVETLRRHYRTLMKTFHPDINPAGLEITQAINGAYALVMDRLTH